MLQKRADGTLEIVHSDLTALITGPNADRFPYTNVSPSFRQNPASPDRRQPYREFTIHYHNANPVQAFQAFYDPGLANTLGPAATSLPSTMVWLALAPRCWSIGSASVRWGAKTPST